jgi:hypothetical protein
MRAKPDMLSEHMSEVQTGNEACEMCLKYRDNLGFGTTYRVHMPHVVPYVVRYVVGRALWPRHGTDRTRSLQTFFAKSKIKKKNRKLPRQKRAKSKISGNFASEE